MLYICYKKNYEGDSVNSIYRKKTIKRLDKKFKLLGIKYNSTKFMNYRVLISLFILLIFLILSNKGYIYGPLFAVLIYFSFEYYLNYKIKLRKEMLNYQAIFFFQILSLTLEGGKDLQGGIKLTCNAIDNDISNEFKKTLHEVELGKSLNEAINNMKNRIPSEEINTVLLNITQNALFGNNIIESLNNQIEYLRDKKMLNIKGKINKMPVKISVVSVIFIIPIILLLLLGPVVINFLAK